MAATIFIKDPRNLSAPTVEIKCLRELAAWLSTLSDKQLDSTLEGIGTYDESNSDSAVSLIVAQQDYYADEDGLIQEQQYFLLDQLNGRRDASEAEIAETLAMSKRVFEAGEVFMQVSNGQ